MTQNPGIILFGRTGTGKSYLVKAITNSNVFRTTDSLTTQARRITEDICYVKELRQNITFTDPTGFEINRNSSFSDFADDAVYLSKIFARSFNVILYCVSAMETRLDKRQIDDLLILQHLFGPEILSHIFIVVTQWDMVNPAVESSKRSLWGRDEIHKILLKNSLSLKAELMVLHADHANICKSVLKPLEPWLRQRPYTWDLSSEIPQRPLGALSAPIVQRYFKHVKKVYEEDNESEKVRSGKKSSGSNSLEVRITVIRSVASYLSGDMSDMLQFIKESSSLPFFQALINYFECEKTNTQRSLFDDIKNVLKDSLAKFSELETNKDFSKDLDQSTTVQLLSHVIDSLTEIIKVDFAHFGLDKEDLKRQTTSQLNISTLANSLQSSFSKIEVNHNHDKPQITTKQNSSFKKQIFFSCLCMALGLLLISTKPLKHSLTSLKSTGTYLDNIFGGILFSGGFPFSILSTLGFLKRRDEKKLQRENDIVNKLHNSLYETKPCKDLIMAILIVYFDLNKV